MIKTIRFWLKLMAGYIGSNRRQFFLGFVASILFLISVPRLEPYFSRSEPELIGMVGDYTISTLPRAIQEEISYGLIKLNDSQLPSSGAAYMWQATDSGKTFIFKLNNDLAWQDGEKLTSSQINYNMRGVTVEKPDEATIKFTLTEPFAPLVTLLSQPLFKNGLIGLNNTKVVDVKFAGRFLASVHLINQNNQKDKIIKFFTTEKSMLTALKLGTIRIATGLHNLEGIDKESMKLQSTEKIDQQTEVVLFFNNNKKPFDDKAFRQGLVYALPDNFAQGETAASPLPQNSWAISQTNKIYSQNIQLAKKLAGKSASDSANHKIVIATTKELEPVAVTIRDHWKTANIESEIQINDVRPVNYDAYLGYLPLPPDPDQYMLWHSTQTQNIAGYKSFKVDKLLEEGRKETDSKKRKEIYANFQKAITEDVPVAFLFYPRVYTLSR